MRLILAACAALTVAACNPVANLNAGEERIASFQAAYSSGNVDRLWGMAGPDFKRASSREEFGEFVEVLEARLGPVESSERDGFNVNTNNGVTVTTVQMATRFEQGDGSEIYTFSGHGEDMQLVGWTVNSDRLMLTADDLSRMEGNTDDAAEGATDESLRTVIRREPID